MQFEDLSLDKYNGHEKCGDEMCQKNQNERKFNFTNPNEVILIALESYWKCLIGEINLASKFLVFFNGIQNGKTSESTLVIFIN